MVSKKKNTFSDNKFYLSYGVCYAAVQILWVFIWKLYLDKQDPYTIYHLGAPFINGMYFAPVVFGALIIYALTRSPRKTVNSILISVGILMLLLVLAVFISITRIRG